MPARRRAGAVRAVISEGKGEGVIMRPSRTRIVPVVFVLIGVVVVSQTAFGCYAVVAGKDATADGSVLVGHAEQNGPGKIFLNFRVVPRIRHEPGDRVVLKDGGCYPEPAESYKYLWSENYGLPGSDGVMNEWGVICVSDGTHTKEKSIEDLRAGGDIACNGILYMLRIELAKRARTAREGIRTFARLIDRFGYGGSGTTFVIADPNEAWVVTVVMGKRWVAERVPDDEVALVPNVNIIQEIDLSDSSRFLGSPDIITYAEKKGWYDPKSGRPFNFRDAYDKPSWARWFEPEYHCDPRRWRGQSLVTGQETPLPAPGPLPFSVKPNRKLKVEDIRAILSDHMEGTRFDKTNGYALGSPHDIMRSSDGMICNQENQEIAVFQLRSFLPPAIGCIYWRTTAAGCSSVLTPWYAGITDTPEAYYRPVDLALALTEEFHFNPPAATYSYDETKAFWIFNELENLVDLDYKKNIGKVKAVFQAFERDEYRMQDAVEETACGLFAINRDLGARFLTDYCAGRALQAIEKARLMTRELKEEYFGY
jgi:dipeptidase